MAREDATTASKEAESKSASSIAAASKAEEQDTLARTKDKSTKILGTAIGHAVTLGLWRMRHDEATQNAVQSENLAVSEAAAADELEQVRACTFLFWLGLAPEACLMR